MTELFFFHIVYLNCLILNLLVLLLLLFFSKVSLLPESIAVTDLKVHSLLPQEQGELGVLLITYRFQGV